VAAGSPEGLILTSRDSHTGRALAKFLRHRGKKRNSKPMQ